jgi:hemerythrin-like domain-containing protein
MGGGGEIMRLTERLKVEHGVFLLQLRQLETMLARAEDISTLRPAFEVIAAAEEHHSRIEEELLHPALARRLGRAFPSLQAVECEHQRLAALTDRIRSNFATEDDVRAYVLIMRRHLESEIHGLFPLAERVIPPAMLAAMCDWDAEHLVETEGAQNSRGRASGAQSLRDSRL